MSGEEKNLSPKHLPESEYSDDQLSKLYQHQTSGQTKKHGGDNQLQQQQDLAIDANYPVTNQYHRRFRASRNFKNPPQPHMCIREKTIDGQELFINVLSWNRIADPSDKNSPIPLFGGMKVQPGSARSPPLVYAVMASPEVLKQSGRKCPDSPERMNLVDLMCEFVEEMNPGLVLSRHPEILKDRDISGELKDVWNAVQVLREKQRAESHYATQENLVVYTEFGPETAPPYNNSQQQQQQQRETVIQYNSSQSAINYNREDGSQYQTNYQSDTLRDHMETISSETENMRISPTENDSNAMDETSSSSNSLPNNNTTTNNNVNNSSQTSNLSSPNSNSTSVIVSTASVTTNGSSSPSSPSPTNTQNNKKDSTNSSSTGGSGGGHSFFPKFRSSKASSHHNQQQQNDHDTETSNNKKEESEHQQPSKHKKFLSYIRRKAGTKNDSHKIILPNGDVSSNNTTSSTTNNTDTTNGKEMITNSESSMIDAK